MSNGGQRDIVAPIVLGVFVLFIAFVSVVGLLSRYKGEYLFFGDGIAQWTMAGIALAGLVVSVIALVWLKRAAVSASETVRETRRIGQAQTRAYLSIDSVEIGLNMEERAVQISMRVKNAGQSPARRVEAVMDFALMGSSIDEPVEIITSLPLREIPANSCIEQPPITLGDIKIPQVDRDISSEGLFISFTMVVFADDVFDQEVFAVFSSARNEVSQQKWREPVHVKDHISTMQGTMTKGGMDRLRRRRIRPPRRLGV